MYICLDPASLALLEQRSTDFILLDTGVPSLKNKYSYLFTKPAQILTVESLDQIPDLLKQIDYWSKFHWVVGYLSYEAGYALENRFQKTINAQNILSSQLAWFGVFKKPYIFDHSTGQWNNRPSLLSKTNPAKKETAIRSRLKHTLSDKDYAQKISQIKRWIGKGHTYQVNFTYDTLLYANCSPFELYCHLRKSQPAPFCSFIKNKSEYVASFSPELFFSQSNNTIRVKPMKGTAPRGRFTLEDDQYAAQLERDTKNRSENVMIVDLLRNDLGRICKTGSVITEKLFQVETHYTVHQMTSTVRGTLKPSISFSDIISNLFPCGSVTGAPKVRTMEIIHSVEKGLRGVYCGALGFVSPKGQAVFNVPIRTLQKSRNKKSWRFRVGSGIVWDSSAKEEWNECSTKCKFLLHSKPEFELFESFLWNNRLVYLQEHKKRLKESAQYYGFPYSGNELNRIISKIQLKLKDSFQQKVRIFLSKEGAFHWDAAPLIQGKNPLPLLVISSKPVDESNHFLFHKTTYRPWYAKATQKIRHGECFDVAFFNSKGEITEGARSNIFIQKNDIFLTPKLECGLLPGVLRSLMLKKKKCFESVLYKSDLLEADAIYCSNSVRGLVQVNLPKK